MVSSPQRQRRLTSRVDYSTTERRSCIYVIFSQSSRVFAFPCHLDHWATCLDDATAAADGSIDSSACVGGSVVAAATHDDARDASAHSPRDNPINRYSPHRRRAALPHPWKTRAAKKSSSSSALIELILTAGDIQCSPPLFYFYIHKSRHAFAVYRVSFKCWFIYCSYPIKNEMIVIVFFWRRLCAHTRWRWRWRWRIERIDENEMERLGKRLAGGKKRMWFFFLFVCVCVWIESRNQWSGSRKAAAVAAASLLRIWEFGYESVTLLQRRVAIPLPCPTDRYHRAGQGSIFFERLLRG